MKLQKLALQYKDFFLDTEYHIITENDDIIVINGQTYNFLHLTGLQDCLSPNINPTKFYYDCIHGQYGDVKALLSNTTNEGVRNMIKIKTNNFHNLQNCIMQKGTLYQKGDDFGFCNSFIVGTKTKYHTFLFKYIPKLGFCVPKSNQIEKADSYSKVHRDNYTPIQIKDIIIVK